jgi:2-phosphosulfolactate phosphatase
MSPLFLPQINTRVAKTHVTLVIDVFRAFTTACYVLEDNPITYNLTTRSSVIARLAQPFPHAILIGKPELGSFASYTIPNSPTRVSEIDLTNRTVFHRTEAGARGILISKNADVILAAGFINADATVQHIKTLTNPELTILPMGHEGITPSLEDDLCALYIEALFRGDKIDISPYLSELKECSGKCFFSEDQWQYPVEDFARCLEIDRFNFAIEAVIFDDYAVLNRVSALPEAEAVAVQSESQQSLFQAIEGFSE